MSDLTGHMQRQAAIIDQVGWAVTAVVPDVGDPDTVVPFAYTVGLTAHGYPELLVTGLDPRVSQSLLNDLASRVYDRAERFTHGQRITDLLVGYDAVIVEGPATERLHPGSAIAQYGEERVSLQQVVWPDVQGRFPWESGYAFQAHAQPLIARLA